MCVCVSDYSFTNISIKDSCLVISVSVLLYLNPVKLCSCLDMSVFHIYRQIFLHFITLGKVCFREDMSRSYSCLETVNKLHYSS